MIKLEKIKEQVKRKQEWLALNNMLKLLHDTPNTEWKKHSQELVDIWQLLLSLNEKTWIHEILERTVIISLEYAIKNTIDLKILEQLIKLEEVSYKNGDNQFKEFSNMLKNFAMIAIQQGAQQNAWQEVAFFAKHIDRMSVDHKFNVQENLLMANVWYKLENSEKVYKYIWDAMADNSPSKIFVTDTIYNLLLYLILFPDWRNTCFFIGPSISNEIINKLLSHDVAGFYSVHFLDNMDLFGDLIRNFASYAKDKDIPTYGLDHYRELSRYFIRNGNFIVLEDGVANYRNTIFKNKVILENGREYMPLGYDDSVKCVYLTGRMRIPEKLQKKAVIFDMKKLWKQKSSEEKKIIQDIFSVRNSSFFKLLNQNKNQILLTQPLYEKILEDPNISREQLVYFYKKILKNYDTSRIIIKVHPRDNLNYEVIFPEFSICRDKFPFEFIYLLDMEDKINKLISINSTVSYGLFEESKIDLYEKEWNQFINNNQLPPPLISINLVMTIIIFIHITKLRRRC